jgi:tripartite-type tricarboxylate transporter receptor subunit TctC
MFAPTGTPKAVTTWLQVEVNKVLDDHDAIAKLATLGCEPYKGNPDSLNQLVQFDLVRWAKIVKDSGAKVD